MRRARVLVVVMLLGTAGLVGRRRTRSEHYPVAFDVVVPEALAPGAATLRVGSVGVPLAVRV